ncbi:MAG TPA: TPM domain-containing protein [Rhodanobacteraceae bacterium]|jgi:uncharacterized membrane protein|nr:TPM domain-containing protein [Rhodanobacteraceae bacterium]
MRWIRHLAAGASVRRLFPQATLDAIHHAIAEGEKRHRGEVCFAIEQAMPWRDLARGRSARERAQDVFAQLRVWDTQHNSGVLIYLLVAERAIEIVADRGIAARVGQQEWQRICDGMRERFVAHDYERGVIDGVRAVSDMLAKHFPDDGSTRNELADAPVML